LKSAVTGSHRVKLWIGLRRKFCGLTSAFLIRCTPRLFTQDLQLKFYGLLLAGNNYHHIDQIALFAIGTIEPPCLFRIIDSVKIQPLANDDAFQKGDPVLQTSCGSLPAG
jgi:hypothetical protein